VVTSSDCPVSNQRRPKRHEHQLTTTNVDNVDPSHVATIEFIRTLVSRGKMLSFSLGDSKLVEWAEISDFLVIVTTRTDGGLPPCFLGHFAVIQLASPCQASSRSIAERTLVAFGDDVEHVTGLTNFADTLLQLSLTCAFESDLLKITSSFLTTWRRVRQHFVGSSSARRCTASREMTLWRACHLT
jgi:hypothetical protein